MNVARGTRSQGRRAQAAVLAGGLVLVGLLWVALLGHLAQRRESVLDQTRRDVTNLSIAIAEQVSRLIEGTDQMMRLIQADHDADPETFDFSAWLRRATSLDAVTTQISIFGENGDLTTSRVPPQPGAPRVSNADRPYFRFLAENPQAGLYVGRTIQGRILGIPSFQLVRRLARPGGGFAGILIVSLNPDYLTKQFGALDVGKDGSIALFGRDGYIRARSPATPGMYEIDATKAPQGAGLFGHLEHSPVGTYEVRSVFDGMTRVFGYRSLDGLPLVVTVGKSVEEVLVAFHAEARRTLSVGAAVTLILLAGLAGLLMELDRRRKREVQLVAANEAVAASDARFRLIAEHATDMIVQLDRTGRRVFVSPASLKLLGFAPEDLIGTLPAESVHPDDVAGFNRAIKALVRGASRTAVSTHRVRHRDGTWVWVEASWQVVKDAGGRISGFVASLRSVMARREAEMALRESEARYRTLADTLPQLIWVSRTSDGEAIYVNKQFDSYCGPIGTSRKARRHLAHPDEVEALSAAWEAAKAAGRVFEAERRLRRHDGAYRWHKIVMIPMHQDGAITGWLGTALDIDEIIAARKELEKTSDLLRLAHHGAGAGPWDFDLVTGEIILSPESAHLHGLPTEGPTFISLEEWKALGPREDADETLRLVNEAVASRDTFETEFRVALPDGGVRWIQGIGRTYYDPSGIALRMAGLNFDITGRKDAELALRHAKNAAETARLEAERASAAKTDFLASMSHEIRTPLHAVIGFTDLLAGSNRLAPDLRRQAELARSSGSALLTIVDDILDFSKVEAGLIELDRQTFAPAALVDNCLSIIRGTAAAKGLEVRAVVDATLPPGLVGDQSRLRQVLLNLLNNAVKFTRSGSVTLSLRHEGSSDCGEQLRFSVTDTGIGIPADKHHRLFARFSQVDGSIRRHFGGTGLGLAICKHLVELMGGEIGVSSDEGRGATFWFALSLPRGSLPSALAEVTTAPVSGRSGRLLLVEDLPINQMLARAVLEAAGHRVDAVDDGEAAVAAVQAKSYDLVLMDVQMPGMDGMTATRLIRSLDHPASTVPIVAMTANVLPEEVVRFRQAGMDDHVGKPFNRADLYAVIDRWLPGQPGPETAGPEVPGIASGLDRAVFDDLIELHTPPGVVRLLGYLDEELNRSFRGDADGPEARTRLRHEAHVLVSAAGMVGFLALSSACADLEACTEARMAGKGETLFTTQLDRVRSHATAAIEESRRLAASLQDGSMPRAVVNA